MAQRKREAILINTAGEWPAEAEKQAFIDRTIIALFARGYPQDKLFERAELLWRLREENRKR